MKKQANSYFAIIILIVYIILKNARMLKRKTQLTEMNIKVGQLNTITC